MASSTLLTTYYFSCKQHTSVTCRQLTYYLLLTTYYLSCEQPLASPADNSLASAVASTMAARLQVPPDGFHSSTAPPAEQSPRVATTPSSETDTHDKQGSTSSAPPAQVATVSRVVESTLHGVESRLRGRRCRDALVTCATRMKRSLDASARDRTRAMEPPVLLPPGTMAWCGASSERRNRFTSSQATTTIEAEAAIKGSIPSQPRAVAARRCVRPAETEAERPEVALTRS